MKFNFSNDHATVQADKETQIILGACRESLTAYCFFMMKGFQLAKHHKLLISVLEDTEKGDLSRLGIFMPPRNGKSQISSILFVAWYLGRNPTHNAIFATYGQSLADHFGRQVRNIVTSPKHLAVFPYCKLSDDSTAANQFSLSLGGSYTAVGRGGPLTGKGAHLLLIDDPLKDDQEARSEAIRESLKDWYAKVAYTRLTPKGSVVLIQTRWHVDDLAGWLLREHQDEHWKVLSLPAIAEEDEGWRKEGEPLWPERFSLDKLYQIQSQIGEDGWNALYQQHPTLGGGYWFKRDWMRFYSQKPGLAEVNRYILVDPANSKKKGSDSTAMVVIGLGADRNYYVLDMVRDWLNLTERAECLFRLHRLYRPLGVGYEAYGLNADVSYLKDKMERENYRFEITELAGLTAKQDRIKRLVPMFQSGRFYFPQDIIYVNSKGQKTDIVEHFIQKELVVYPAAKNDDLLDAMARIEDPLFNKYFPMTWEEQAELHAPSRNVSWMAL